MQLPQVRGPLTGRLFPYLQGDSTSLGAVSNVDEDQLVGDDFHLALYACYELHYRGFADVDERSEWDPEVISFRTSLESLFEGALIDQVGTDVGPDEPVPSTLIELANSEDEVSLSRYLERQGTDQEFREFMIHRSAYQLKESDPHSWAIPRLDGVPKAALIEIQTDEYGAGDPEKIHAVLFGKSMEAMGLDHRYGAYLNSLPGITLATVNLMSMFGLHRRWRGAVIGHLALFEMTSTEPNRRYGNALRRLGYGEDVTFFFDEHVEADSVHEQIAAHDLAGGLARQDPTLSSDIIFGARSLLFIESLWARHLLENWDQGRSSLLDSERVISIA
jgi:hypothetical protein